MPDHSLPAVPARDTRPVPACRLTDWKPWPQANPSLIGHATVAFNSGWTINSIPIFRRGDGSFSAGPPSMPQIGPDGRQKTDASGKKVYAPVMSFDVPGRALWNAAIIGALAAAGIRPDGEGAA